MNKIFDKCDEINKYLLKTELIKDYLDLNYFFEHDKKFKKEVNEMDYYRTCEIQAKDMKLSLSLYFDVIKNPLVKNYINLKEEVSLLMEDVKKELSL